jgi:hypothetical protein
VRNFPFTEEERPSRCGQTPYFYGFFATIAAQHFFFSAENKKFLQKCITATPWDP